MQVLAEIEFFVIGMTVRMVTWI